MVRNSSCASPTRNWPILLYLSHRICLRYTDATLFIEPIVAIRFSIAYKLPDITWMTIVPVYFFANFFKNEFYLDRYIAPETPPIKFHENH